MGRKITKIYFIHEGKAAYPEIAAYRAFFADRFVTEEIGPEQVASRSDLGQSLCWFIMGYYPERPAAACVIHDYRSLSVGRTWYIKNKIKSFLNAEPDIRIFQNEDMLRAMHFSRQVPTVFLPMGVPSFVLDARHLQRDEPNCDFCYIGVMSMERRSPLMFESFLDRFGASKMFHLYGTPEAVIADRYKEHANIVFHGKKSQADVFAALMRTRVAVNYFPTHNPHCLQTPTKLLEYAALGLRILCNEQRQSRSTAQAYGLNCLWGPAHDMFRNVPDELTWLDNGAFDPSPLMWPSVIARSGVAELIEAEVAR